MSVAGVAVYMKRAKKLRSRAVAETSASEERPMGNGREREGDELLRTEDPE